MEPQTRFDLNQAVAQWRSELQARPGLVADDVKELESHLGEQVATFVGKGLSEADAFWLSKRHLGNTDELVGEFQAAKPERIWAERILWIVFGLAGYSAWSAISTFAVSAVWIATSALMSSSQGTLPYGSSWSGGVANLVLAIVFVCIVFSAGKGRFFGGWSNGRIWRISTWALGVWLVLESTKLFLMVGRESSWKHPELNWLLISQNIGHLIVPAVLLALANDRNPSVGQG